MDVNTVINVGKQALSILFKNGVSIVATHAVDKIVDPNTLSKFARISVKVATFVTTLYVTDVIGEHVNEQIDNIKEQITHTFIEEAKEG